MSRFKSASEPVGGGSGLHAEGGIDDVRAGEAHMDESGVRANGLASCAQEGDDIVVNFPFDVRIRSRSHVAARIAGIALSGMRPRRFQAVAHGFFDGQPCVDSLPLAPNRAHFRAGIAIDHGFPTRSVRCDSCCRSGSTSGGDHSAV